MNQQDEKQQQNNGMFFMPNFPGRPGPPYFDTSRLFIPPSPFSPSSPVSTPPPIMSGPYGPGPQFQQMSQMNMNGPPRGIQLQAVPPQFQSGPGGMYKMQQDSPQTPTGAYYGPASLMKQKQQQQMMQMENAANMQQQMQRQQQKQYQQQYDNRYPTSPSSPSPYSQQDYANQQTTAPGIVVSQHAQQYGRYSAPQFNNPSASQDFQGPAQNFNYGPQNSSQFMNPNFPGAPFPSGVQFSPFSSFSSAPAVSGPSATVSSSFVDVSMQMRGKRPISAFSLAEELKHYLKAKKSLIYNIPEFDDLKIPKKVHHVYHSLFPIENIANPEDTNSKVFFQQKTEVYKAINSNDTYPCVLRRVLSKEYKNRTQTNEFLICIKKWKSFRHANFVALKDVFETSDFTKGNINDLIFVYDFVPNGMTLETLFSSALPNPYLSSNSAPNTNLSSNFASANQSFTVTEEENLLISYLIQLYSVLSKLHSPSFELYAGNLMHPSKILTHPLRVKKIFLNCGGINDVLNLNLNPKNQENSNSESKDIKIKNDWKKLGVLILGLAGRDFNGATKNPQAILEKLEKRNFSKKFLTILNQLVLDNQTTTETNAPFNLLFENMMNEMVLAQEQLDRYEAELEKQMDNDRLFRLLAKLSFVFNIVNSETTSNSNLNLTNSEISEIRILQLFQKFLFSFPANTGSISNFSSQTFPNGFLIENLNKLDAGIEEKVVLISNDKQTIISISFKELKRLVRKFLYQQNSS